MGCGAAGCGVMGRGGAGCGAVGALRALGAPREEGAGGERLVLRREAPPETMLRPFSGTFPGISVPGGSGADKHGWCRTGGGG